MAGAGSERMRIDSSGNLLVGKTVTAIAYRGTDVRGYGLVRITVERCALHYAGDFHGIK